MRERLVSVLGSVLLIAVTATWGQRVINSQSALTDDASLEATMTFIQAKLNSIGAVRYVTHAHDLQKWGRMDKQLQG